MKNIVKSVLRLAVAGIIFGMANIYSITGMFGRVWLIPVLLFGFLIINVLPLRHPLYILLWVLSVVFPQALSYKILHSGLSTH